MALSQALYRNALRTFRALSPAMMRGQSKLARGLRGRRDAHERLVAWGRETRGDGDGCPVLWVHASSVGESLQARAVVDVLRSRTPGLRVVFTYFSPSAEAIRDFPADLSSYLPWDLPEVLGPVLDAVRPNVIAFTQREVWPTLVEQAGARDVPTVLIAGTMPRGAGRLSLAGRILLGVAFRSLRSVAVVSTEDADRFGLLGVRSDRMTVTGDPGIDSAGDRVSRIDRGVPHMRIFEAGPEPAEQPVVVAGSTWPADEMVLIPALAKVRASIPGLRVILAPHEPDGYDFASLGRTLAEDGWTPRRLSEIETGAARDGGQIPDAVLVDRVGVLADLYGLASVAFVGGGFGRGGLHSVLEPAAAGVPVVVGPHYEGSIHASGLLAAGAARTVADRDSLAESLLLWLEVKGKEVAPKNDDHGQHALDYKNDDHGQHALDYIEDRRGAAARTAPLISQFFPHQAGPGTLSEGET